MWWQPPIEGLTGSPLPDLGAQALIWDTETYVHMSPVPNSGRH